MRKTLSFALALSIALTAFAGCAGPLAGGSTVPPIPPATPAPSEKPGIESIRTIGDALALDSPEYQSAALEKNFVYVFLLDGVYYRAVAPLSAETAALIWALDYDENYDARWKELVSPLKVEKIENLSALIPSRTELDGLIGKTGAELLDDGWKSYGYNLDAMEFFLAKDPFKYTVAFDGELEMSEDFDEYEALRDLTVKSIVFDGLGDATNLDGETP